MAGTVLTTPLVPSPNLGRLTGADIHLKLENLQRTGSFKIRGAFNKLSRLAATDPKAKVVAASAGNHAQGVALAAGLLGLEAVIFMPVNASLSKQEATAGYGAEVRLEGENVEESLAAAKALPGGYTLVHPFDDEDVVCGQATLGLEIMAALPDAEAVVVPVGGGGLLAGVASAVKMKNPTVKVIGVEPDRAASLTAALEMGRPIQVDTRPTLADGTRVARVGDRTLPLIRSSVDDVVRVREEHIAQAMLLLLEWRRVVAEGAGALPLAAFLAGVMRGLDEKKVVLVVSGGNVDANPGRQDHRSGIGAFGPESSGSTWFWTTSPVRWPAYCPLSRPPAPMFCTFTTTAWARNLPVTSTRVGLELETRGFTHAAEIENTLKAQGYEAHPGVMRRRPVGFAAGTLRRFLFFPAAPSFPKELAGLRHGQDNGAKRSGRIRPVVLQASIFVKKNYKAVSNRFGSRAATLSHSIP